MTNRFIKIKRRFFVITTISFTASTLFSSCSSPTSSSNNALNASATTDANTVATRQEEKIKVGVSPVPAGV